MSNLQTVAPVVSGDSRFHGVRWHRGVRRWEGRLGDLVLGLYDREEDCARAVDEELRKNLNKHNLRGYQLLNFPSAEEQRIACRG